MDVNETPSHLRNALSDSGYRKPRPRSVDEPASTITSKTRPVYRGGSATNSTRRDIESPAPTVYFGHAQNTVEWMDAQDADDPRKRGRQVTVTEAAVLQSFPHDYPWAGSRTRQYQQIGDAIPPVLAAAIVAQFVRAT